jgi:hypothetical protein
MSGRLKDWRRFATRYDRFPTISFLAVAFAAAVIFWLRSVSSEHRAGAPVSKSGSARSVGSSPTARTSIRRRKLVLPSLEAGRKQPASIGVSSEIDRQGEVPANGA